MRVSIRKVAVPQEEQVVLECMALTPDFADIQNYCLARGRSLSGESEGRQRPVYYDEIYYIEAVGEKVFACTANEEVEVKTRLYKLEEQLADFKFVRCSKAFLISLLKIESIRPALNGRYCARMKNGEDVIISRKYARAVRRSIKEALSWSSENI